MQYGGCVKGMKLHEARLHFQILEVLHFNFKSYIFLGLIVVVNTKQVNARAQV